MLRSAVICCWSTSTTISLSIGPRRPILEAVLSHPPAAFEPVTGNALRDLQRLLEDARAQPAPGELARCIGLLCDALCDEYQTRSWQVCW